MRDAAEELDAAEAAVRAIQAGGDPEIHFEAVFARYYEPLYHFFRNQGYPENDCDDLAQETLLRVLQSLGGFRFDAALDTWVFLIARHVWNNAWRARTTKKRRGIELPLEEVASGEEPSPGSAEPLPSPAPDPLAEALAREREEVLFQAFAELPPRMRACVELRVGHGLKQGEIAAAMQITVETVKTQLKAARERLRPRLARYFGADSEEPFT